MRKSTFLGGASGAALLGPMSATERRMGRYMRGPGDGDHPSGGGGGGSTPTPTPTPSASGGFDFPDELDSLDNVPERARPLYVKDESSGKFKIDDLSGLRGALQHEKERRKTLAGENANLKKFKDLGKSPEEIQELLQREADAEEKRLKDEGDFESLKSQLQKNHADELEAKDKRISSLTKQIEKLMVTDNARAVLSEEDIQGNPTLLMPAIRDRVEVKENDEGDFLLVVKRPDGTPMLNTSNEPASIRDLALELRGNSEYSGAFKGVNQSGGGAPNKSGGGAPSGNLSRSKMSVREKTAYIREHGQEAYMNLPA